MNHVTIVPYNSNMVIFGNQILFCLCVCALANHSKFYKKLFSFSFCASTRFCCWFFMLACFF